MNEDDTFNALRRPNIHQMLEIYRLWLNDPYPKVTFEKLCLDNNWTWSEFEKIAVDTLLNRLNE